MSPCRVPVVSPYGPEDRLSHPSRETQWGLQSSARPLPRFVLLASGLGLGSGSGESLLGTQLLVDAVTGQLGAEGQQSCAALISRVLLAGNLLSQSTQSRDSLHKVW